MQQDVWIKEKYQVLLEMVMVDHQEEHRVTVTVMAEEMGMEPTHFVTNHSIRIRQIFNLTGAKYERRIFKYR
jgi:hypothetical protein